MQTQWGVDQGRRTGLNYLVLFAFMARMGLSDSDYAEMVSDIQSLEIAALNAMYPPEG